MKVTRLSDYTRGWVIGDFEPSALRTKDFEVAVLTHKQGEIWPAHYHKEGVEYNILISGKMVIQGTELNAGDVFVLDRYEVADPVFLEDCKVVCVKTPSIPSDKFEVTK